MNILFRTIGYSYRHKRLSLSAAVSGVAAVLVHMLIPWVAGSVIDEALTSGLRSRLVLLATAILVLGLLRSVFNYAGIHLTRAAHHRIGYELRKDLFRKMQGLSAGFYDRLQTGDLMSRITVDVDAMSNCVGRGFLHGMSGVGAFGFAGMMMMLIDWRLGLVTLAFIPPLLCVSTIMALRMSTHFEKALQEMGSMNAVVQENLTGMRVVKAFGAGDHEEARFQSRARAVAGHMYASDMVLVSGLASIVLLFAGATAAILLFGGREVFAGRVTPGELASFVLYLGFLATSIFAAGWRVEMFSKAFAAGRRVFEILDTESPVRDRPGAVPLRRARGHVRFERVSLSYDSSRETLRDIDFEALPGQTVAVLGGPGSGKSTAVHLLPRFYEASTGRVLIDGVDVRDITLASLRQNVGIVLQDVFAFSATIRDNIAYGVSGARLDDVVRAAKVAHLHDFVAALSDGYDTWVGERGITLSGGQRQRLAIARTVLMDPPILILDDSTSSVDVGTEALIQRALADVMRDRTTFVIAHRLSTVRNADLILVLEQGEIVERGTHDELLMADGPYRRIYDLQLRPQGEIRLIGDRPFSGDDGA